MFVYIDVPQVINFTAIYRSLITMKHYKTNMYVKLSYKNADKGGAFLVVFVVFFFYLTASGKNA